MAAFTTAVTAKAAGYMWTMTLIIGLYWMIDTQRSDARCRGRLPAVDGVRRPTCLCSWTMFCRIAVRLSPSSTRCQQYDLLLHTWSWSALFLQVLLYILDVCHMGEIEF